MARQKRRIVLFINNCKEHPSAIILHLMSVKVEFMPPNTTSKLQPPLKPLDHGIIHKFKIIYRHDVVKKCDADIDERTKPVVNVLQAMRMAVKA
ncbi:hypothetical protein AVEN_130195-1 [Araneus ventricosus]|uniref:DDE-1 domain-containing protein n=1 Tax=Araneus ventricosus TaxID=182803 RepID=A0A4Y2VCD7_ARAVE|nr:hypothetical protein AVEN_130195-1 [Araneus ventricosus]